MITPDPNRPYPEGIPWDEAYRQRQRADQNEQKLTQAQKQITQLQKQLNNLKTLITQHQTKNPPNP
jgi:hypothetical protein